MVNDASLMPTNIQISNTTSGRKDFDEKVFRSKERGDKKITPFKDIV